MNDTTDVVQKEQQPVARGEREPAEPRPLLRLTEGQPRWFDGGAAALTDDGRDVLAGRADAVRLHGVDVWLGGVRLDGHEVAWRWDAERRHVVG